MVMSANTGHQDGRDPKGSRKRPTGNRQPLDRAGSDHAAAQGDPAGAAVLRGNADAQLQSVEVAKDSSDLPVPYLYELWKYFADNHNLVLLESELWDVVLAVRKSDVGHYCKDIFLRDDVVRCALQAMDGAESSGERAKFTSLLLRTMNEQKDQTP